MCQGLSGLLELLEEHVSEVHLPWVKRGRENFGEDVQSKSSSSLYGDEEGPSGRDGGVHQPYFDGILSLRDNDKSEGNVGTSEQVPIFQNVFKNQIKEVNPGLRRSSRSSKLSAKLNEYSFEPSSFEEASKDPNCINAMNDEMHC
ncbi:hypothetical protein Tco_0684353 [Tanacetum coccineum]